MEVGANRARILESVFDASLFPLLPHKFSHKMNSEEEDNNGNINNNGRRNRDGEDANGNNGRNVRPNQQLIRREAEHWRARVELSLNNLNQKQCNLPGMSQRKAWGRSSRLVSLEDHIASGSQHGTVLLLMILSIEPVVSTQQTSIYQKTPFGSKGQARTPDHDRRVVVMCPLSPVGNNVAMMLIGGSLFKGFFDGNLPLRDDGSTRESSH
jgi:hypothetical protein